MSDVLALPSGVELSPAATPSRSIAGRIEDYATCVALFLIVLLPLAEIVLRRLMGVGISGSTTIVQHLTLVISMLGAALAARESRLLSLATTTFFSERTRRITSILAGAIAACTTAFLAYAAYQFVATEKVS